VTDHGASISFYQCDPDGNSKLQQVDWFDDLDQLV